jgi:hypothetical protein
MITITSQSRQALQTVPSASPLPNESSGFAAQFQDLNRQPLPTASPPPMTPALDFAPVSTTVVGDTMPISPQQDGRSAPNAAAQIKNFIEWQGAQDTPLGQGTIADVWAKQGITDPLSNPVLIGQAEAQLNRAEQRSAMNPNYVAEWMGDWKTHMADAKATESQRQTFMAAADALGKVAVGGGIASRVG